MTPVTLLAALLGACSEPLPEVPKKDPIKDLEARFPEDQTHKSYFQIDFHSHLSCLQSVRARSGAIGILNPVQLCDIIAPVKDKAQELWNDPQFFCYFNDCIYLSGAGMNCMERSVLTCADLDPMLAGTSESISEMQDAQASAPDLEFASAQNEE